MNGRVRYFNTKTESPVPTSLASFFISITYQLSYLDKLLDILFNGAKTMYNGYATSTRSATSNKVPYFVDY